MSSITMISYEQIVHLIKPWYLPNPINISNNYVDTVPNFIKKYRNKNNIFLKNIASTLCDQKFMSEKQIQLFAIWCARQAQYLMKDQCCVDLIDVAKRFYIDKTATYDELNIAIDAANDAICDEFFSSNNDYSNYAAVYNAVRAAYGSYPDLSAYDNYYNDQVDYLLDLFEKGINFD